MSFFYKHSIKKLLEFFFFRRTDIPILIYHSVNDNIQSAALKTIKSHFEFFSRHNYKIISLNEMSKNNYRRTIFQRIICLTFDDGYADFFYNVWPLLKTYNFPAAVFVIVNRIGRFGYLSFDQLQEMLNSGLISVGCHSMSHNYLVGLNEGSLIYEIQDAKKTLEEKLAREIKLFAYPWGGFSPFIKKIVKESGYEMAFTTNQTLTNSLYRLDPHALKRLTITNHEGFLRFIIKISGAGYFFARKLKI